MKALESRAIRLINFESTLVPGLLQTVPYMQAAMRNVGLIDDEAVIDERVVARVQRQGILRKSGAPDFQAVILEHALHNAVGDATVMHGQLVYLLEVVQRPNIMVRIIPRSAGNHPGFSGSFMRLQFRDRPGVVVLENRTSNLFLEDDEDLEVHNHVLVELLSVALSPQESIALLRDLETRLAEEQLHGSSRRQLR